jgi:signal transduction histidine kinase
VLTELLDLRTLLLVLGFAILTMSLVLTSVQLLAGPPTQSHRHLLTLFGLGFLVQGLAGVGFGLRGYLDDSLTISVANSLLLLGLSIETGVFWNYHSKRMPWRAILIAALLGSALFHLAVLGPDGYDLGHGTLTISAISSIYAAVGAMIVLRYWRSGSRLHQLLAGVCMLVGMAFLARTIEALMADDHLIFSPLTVNVVTVLIATLAVPMKALLLILIVTDHTERELKQTSQHLRALEELEHERERSQEMSVRAGQQEMIAHMARGIAHDFNNLLGVISLDHDYLLQQLRADPKHAELVALCSDIDSALCQAQAITAGLMSLGTEEVARTSKVDVRDVLSAVERIICRALPERIAIRVSHPPQALMAMTRADFLTSALINLCWNARDAIADEGVLSIDARACRVDDLPKPVIGAVAGTLVIVIGVEDNGCGIPGGNINGLFNPTFSTKTHRRGHGLGLFMVAQFAKRTGAAVSLESTPGNGTRFTLAVPMSDDQTEAT